MRLYKRKQNRLVENLKKKPRQLKNEQIKVLGRKNQGRKEGNL